MKAGAARNSLVGSRIGRFDIIAEIGTGGMASVYLARSTGSGGFRRLTAIKVMHPHLSSDESFVDMFLDEARVAATIHHPNVVPIIDVGFEDGLVFLIMDYIEGDSFSNVEKVAISLRRRIPIGITLRVVLDALTGLHAAHELCDLEGNHLKIIHRDVSPQNIVVGVDGVSRIVDFGIAKAESRVTTTKVGMIKGKLNFMAPEQLRSAPLDRRVDVFGMGVTLWEAVTLRRLYAGENDFDTARRILSGEYPPLLDFDARLPAMLDEICKKALHPDPEQRFHTAEAFAEAIETHLAGSLASVRDVAAFISGVASQKLERERRAMRESASESYDLDPMSSTVVEPLRHPQTEPEIPPAMLPSTASPRVRAEDKSGPRPSKIRQPTMAMPVKADGAGVGPSPPRARPPTVRAAPMKGPTKGGSSRSTLPPPPPANSEPHEEYDDDNETALFTHRMPGMAAIRASAQEFTAPASHDTHDTLQSQRRPFDPPRAMQPAPKPGGDSVPPEAPDPNEVPHMVQHVGAHDVSSTLQDHPSPAYAVPQPLVRHEQYAQPQQMGPQGGQADPFPPMPPGGWNSAPMAPTVPQSAAPAPKGSNGALLVLLAVMFVGVAVAALLYVLTVARR